MGREHGMSIREKARKIYIMIVKEKGGTVIFLQQKWGAEAFWDGLQ